jgi:hypothetical protein
MPYLLLSSSMSAQPEWVVVTNGSSVLMCGLLEKV